MKDLSENKVSDQGTPDKALEDMREGVRHHNAGRLEEAEAMYRRVLEAHPDNADALHLLGVAARQAGRHDMAVDLIQQAIARNGRNPSFHANLGTALEVSGRREDAMAAYRRAIAIRPDYPEAYFKLGAALRAADKPNDAVQAFRRAIKIKPDYAEAYNELGALLRAGRKTDMAIEALRRAIKIKPDYADAHYNLGLALQRSGRLDEAIQALQRAVELKPDVDSAMFRLTTALLDRNDPAKMVEVCDACLKADPGNRRMLSSKIVALNEAGDRDGARFLLDFDRFIRPTRIEVPAGFDGVADFNKALAHQVCAHPTLEFERAGHATRFGGHTGDLLLDPQGPVAALKELMEGGVEDYMRAMPEDKSHPFPASRPDRWKLTAWAVVMDTRGHQAPHIHSAAWLSGVYYVQLPNIGNLPEQGQAGWIEFGRPQAEFRCKVEPEVKLFQPEEGLMFLFPSYFYHGTVAIETEEQRISIAFDVIPQD